MLVNDGSSQVYNIRPHTNTFHDQLIVNNAQVLKEYPNDLPDCDLDQIFNLGSCSAPLAQNVLNALNYIHFYE